MRKQPTEADSTESIKTGVHHAGQEVAVRCRSTHSRDVHEPETDADGHVVFDDDGDPKPACDIPNKNTDDLRFKLISVDDATGSMGVCSFCTDDADTTDGAGNKTAARILRYGDDWGE